MILSFGNVSARNLVMFHGCVRVSDLVSLTTSFYYLGFVQPCGLVGRVVSSCGGSLVHLLLSFLFIFGFPDRHMFF